MRTRWMLLGLLTLSASSWADEGRYQALPLASAEVGKGGTRAFILDTRDGHVWIWNENEFFMAPEGGRRYGAGFVYQGKLRPGTYPGEFIETPGRK